MLPEKVKKKTPLIVLIFLASFVISLLQKCTDSKTQEVDKTLKQVAMETNKQCPLAVDSITTMENTFALPRKIFQYNYYLKIDTLQTPLAPIKQNLTTSISNAFKTNPQLKYFKDNDVKIIYSYSDMSGKFLFKLEITPDMYK